MADKYLINLFSLYIFFNGIFYVAVSSFFSFSLINILNILIFIFLLSFFLKNSNFKSSSFILVFLFFLFLIGKLIYSAISGDDIISEFNEMLRYQNFIMILYYINFNYSSQIRDLLLRNLSVGFYITSCFFLIQFLFQNQLPDIFLNLPYNYDANLDKYIRNYQGSSIYRPNGLFGNPIELGLFANLFLFINHKFSFKFSYKAINISIAVIIIMFLASRANIILMCLLLLNMVGIKFYRIYSLLFFLLLIYPILQDLLQIDRANFILDRFLERDEYAAASTLKHFLDISTSIDYFLNAPVFGYSNSFILKNQIITDGALFILLLKWGIAGLLIFISLILRISKKNIFLILLILIYSVLNSALIGPLNLYICAIILGLSNKFDE